MVDRFSICQSLEKQVAQVVAGMQSFSKTFLFLILILVSWSSVFTQDATETIPELWESYHSAKNDSTQITKLAELSFRYLRNNADSAALLAKIALQEAQNKKIRSAEAAAYLSLADTYGHRASADSALMYYNEAIDICLELNFTKGLARGYNSRGSFYHNYAQLDSALVDYKKSLAISEQLNDHVKKAAILHNLGQVYSKKGLYHEALTRYLDARNLKDSLINTPEPLETDGSRARTLINLGALYQELGQFELAKEANEEALTIFDEDKPFPRMVLLYNVGILEEELGNYDAAEDLIQQSLNFAESLNAVSRQPYYHDALGNVYKGKKQSELAKVFYGNALAMLDTVVQNPILKAGVLTNLGGLHYEDGDYQEALRIGRDALELAEINQAPRETLKAHDLIARAAYSLDDHGLASIHQRFYIVGKDSLDGEQRRKELVGLQAIKDRELEEVHHQRDLANIRAEVISERNRYLAIALGAILLLALALAFARRSLAVANDQLQVTNGNLEENNVKLFASNQQLGISNNKLQQFTFAAGHDLKESLRNITSFTQLAALDISKDTQTYTHLREASDAGKRMRKLLDDLLHYGSLTGAKDQQEVILLDEVVSSVKHFLNDDISKKQGDIHMQNQLKLKADRIAIEQLFFNIFHNSLKFSRKGHPPRISVKCIKEEDKSSVTIVIKDNGMGIDPKFKNEVFEPFNRLHSRDVSGSGLGLAICKRIVQDYGGSIYISETSDSGTTIQFTLPTASPSIVPLTL